MVNRYEWRPENPPSIEHYLNMTEEEKNLEIEKSLARLKRIMLLIRYQVDMDFSKSH